MLNSLQTIEWGTTCHECDGRGVIDPDMDDADPVVCWRCEGHRDLLLGVFKRQGEILRELQAIRDELAEVRSRTPRPSTVLGR